ncbi:cob(I)yrinic acid a,c-diamide adenosyltransferase [Candidatus Nitrosocosmicus franklandus]|uniref:Cob(I)yrinic acid a,c-diamide adenosyltransferase n=1 Tax=Candidatus Nitrosocosmicus franklandianus TaxID=1798806 RepID=A0A484I5U7_9ARCH|nr:cob(I)yrinic acid a,c-diamide adenosyltransferase [Candidatus Nitrosocosmicus franklandus]VFJ12568.1 Cob(I)yrinic acid a,c-diamide adenosyltransferase [Candidatus Nitrosocosmicus franklandus]
MKIYTKTGDKGTTSLIDGSRVIKSSKRIQAYGIIDEVNSNVGLLISLLYDIPELTDLKDSLLKLQEQLFVLGSDLANPSSANSRFPRITNNDISRLENQMDEMEESLSPLKSFILPGGSVQASQCHVIRTIIRRAEISMVELYLNKEISESSYVYINRLSDFFFVLARTINSKLKQDDIVWKP